LISFSIDVDWAHEEVIKDTLSLFEQYNVKCTIFSTHSSYAVIKSSRKLFEVALHPNFNPTLAGGNKSVDDVIDELMEIHPDAKGVRSHSLMQSSGLLQKFADKGLVYDANLLLPYHTGLKPFRLWNGMIRIPYNWEDDVHWSYGYTFDESRMKLDKNELIVFDFHPIHIFLNTDNKYRYNEAKKYNTDPKKLITYRNNEIKGTRDLLISLLEYVNKNKIENKTLLEIANAFIFGAKA
jgi:hypothetical protein